MAWIRHSLGYLAPWSVALPPSAGPFLATVSRRGTNGKDGLKSESWRRTPMQCGAS